MNDNARFQRVQEIFLAALELEGAEREAFLGEQCGDDAALRREVDELLALDADGDETFLAIPAAARLAAEHPERIGPYVNLVPIGAGGFADVYAADQTAPLKRRVAIKILKPGLDTRAVLRRFAEERQTLALLDHPNIARVHDAGTTDQGRPYFVMELIEGEPIDRYAAHRALDLAARLALVRQVCAAVQHAHQKGVIHRDLKPSNILVAEVDGRPVPKVIDFGIAKAVTPDDDLATLLTEQGLFIGTPEYISPEQAVADGQGVDTRTDIYSLGVVLYELLTGELPLSRERLRAAGLAERLRLLREFEPPRPSTRVRELTSAGRRPATLNGTEAGLARRLRGELDWIVLKALAKEPDRRYPSASGLADDLVRYLRHEPVEARPPSRMYRWSKTVRRYRALAGAVVLILVVLAGALVDSVHRRHQVEAARAESEAVTEFLSKTLAEADPWATGRDVTVKEVVQQAARTVGDEFPDAPLIRARIEETIGHTLDRLGDQQTGEALMRQALEVQRAQLGVDDPATQNTMMFLSELLRRTDALAESIALDSTVVAARLKRLGPDDVKTRQVQANLAMGLMDAGRNEEAEKEFLAALAPGVTNPDDQSGWEWNTRDALANLYAYAGRMDEADAQYQAALEGRIALSGLEDVQTSYILGNLSLLRWDQGRAAECDSLLELTLDIRRKLLGDDHQLTLTAAQNLAGVRSVRGHYREAAAIYEQIRPVVERDPGTQLHAAVLHNLAYAYLNLGRLREAAAANDSALAIRERIFGPGHRATLATLNNRGMILAAQGRPAEAARVFRDCIAGRTKLVGPDHQDTLGSEIELARVLRALGEPDSSLTLLTAVHDRAAASAELGPDHPVARRALLERGRTRAAMGDDRGALVDLEPAVEAMAAAEGDSNPNVREALGELEAVYRRLGRTAADSPAAR